MYPSIFQILQKVGFEKSQILNRAWAGLRIQLPEESDELEDLNFTLSHHIWGWPTKSILAASWNPRPENLALLGLLASQGPQRWKLWANVSTERLDESVSMLSF